MKRLREFSDLPSEVSGGKPLYKDSDFKRLLKIFRAADIREDEIKRGIELTNRGYQVIAVEMGGVSIEQARNMVNGLIGHLRGDDDMMETYHSMMEDDDQYGYEPDALGNVTVRDSVSGREVFLRGAQAGELMSALKSGARDEQSILAFYMEHAELNEAAIYEDEEDYGSEVASSSGTYNFPWKFEGRHGTATADYSGKASPTSMRIVSVRDAEGSEINPDAETEAALKKQAIAFIGDA